MEPYQAIEQLFREFFKPLSMYAVTFVQDIDTAKDIVHEVFENLWEKRDEIDLDRPMKSYLYSSVHNRALNHIRNHKKFSRADQELIALVDEGDSGTLESNESIQLIQTSIDALPDRCREVFLLSRFENKKYQEIADELGISVKTVETQMGKALKILREKLSHLLVWGIVFLLTFF